MSEMKLIMENFRRFSEQMCDGGQCKIKTTPLPNDQLRAYLKQLNSQLASTEDPADKKAIKDEINRVRADLGMATAAVKEQSGETGPDPLGLRNFGNIASIKGYQGFEGESMENNQKTYKHLFANLKSAQAGKEYVEMAATRSRENKRMLASKKISLASAEIVERPDLATFGQAQNQPRELKVTWNVGNTQQDKSPEPIPVAPASSPI